MGGMPDHVHLLVRWRPDESISDLLREVKSRSSGWIHDTFPEFGSFAWQDGYSAFSVSASQVEAVERYIANQHIHHGGMTYQEEVVALLRKHGIEYDERYLWD